MAGNIEDTKISVCVPKIEGKKLIEYLEGSRFTGAIVVRGEVEDCAAFVEGYCSFGEGRCKDISQLMAVPSEFIVPR
jgi:hypothetical protein